MPPPACAGTILQADDTRSKPHGAERRSVCERADDLRERICVADIAGEHDVGDADRRHDPVLQRTV